jgi:hypothetical protein
MQKRCVCARRFLKEFSVPEVSESFFPFGREVSVSPSRESTRTRLLAHSCVHSHPLRLCGVDTSDAMRDRIDSDWREHVTRVTTS